ncbi:hypothetical protein PybrP1_010669 [[Pythium] brassicae (nom. inval.)]|nr:hypothetical protein PybrP1_010669 [[Pythium] brassicae (nom. inval.)]
MAARLLRELGAALLLLAVIAEHAAAVANGRFQFTQAVYTTTEDFGVAYVTVQRSLGADGRAAVYVSTLLSSGGNAVPGRDFKPVFNRSLVWQDGDDLEKELYVKVLNDGAPQEQPKRFTLYLHDANGAQINPERNITQVVLAPPANLYPGSFRFLTATVDANEVAVDVDAPAASGFAIPVLWENGTTSTAQVKFSVVCGSACSPGDFTVLSPPNALLQWTRGGPTVQSIVLAIPGDDVYEQIENFRVRLELVEVVEGDGNAPLGGVGVIGAIGEVLVHITGPNDVHSGSIQFDTECFPDCAAKTYRVQDGGAALVVLQRRNGSDGAASVTLRTIDGTARAAVDYKPLLKRVQWAEGDAQDKSVVVEALAGVTRLGNKRFSLELSDVRGAVLSGRHASTSFVDVLGPSNIRLGEVNFVQSEPLEAVLRYPDESFLALATRLNSRLGKCPRITVSRPGALELLLRRDFANVAGPASVTLRTIDATATAGVDFAPLAPAPATELVVAWKSGESADKRVTLTIFDPKQFDPNTRYFGVEIASVENVRLGNCHRLQVALSSVSDAPRVTAFDLDMNSNKLVLTLSRPVFAATVDASKLRLQSTKSAVPATTQTLQLSRLTTTASSDGARVVLDLSESDMNALKMVSGLAKSAASVFLAVSPGLFQYVLDGCVSPGSSDYSVDLTQQLLKLRFSEPVDRTKVRVDALTFADTAAATNVYSLSPTGGTRVFSPTPDPLRGATLQDGTKLPADGTYVVLQLGKPDIDALRALGNGQVGVQRASTFLSVSSAFLSDLAAPPNALRAIETPGSPLLQATVFDCSACPDGTFLSASCSDARDRVCSACSVCPTNSFAVTACSATQDTVCYPCTECRGSQFAPVACTPTTDRVCATCTKCTRNEYEASPCINGVDRVCHSCDSCALTKEQQRTCQVSAKWRRKTMKAPYACPLQAQTYQTLEARLQRLKSNRCGAGRCSCTNSGVGNLNPNADSFPDDDRCTEPAAYNIYL